MSETPEAVTFVVPGDLHLTTPDRENYRVARWMVAEINEQIRPDFVQFIGDNVQDATEDQFRLFDDLRGRLEVPHFALVGDHDVHDDPEARRFRDHVGPTYGSNTLRGFRFFRLNMQQAQPLGISADQIEWLCNQVDRSLLDGEDIVIFQHNYPYQIWETFDGPGIDDWRTVVQSRQIMAIVCGHTHYWQVANDGRNVVLATRSIGDPEGGPPGYTTGHVQGQDLAFTYRAIGEEGPIVLVTHPRETLLATRPSHVVHGPDRVRVRFWSMAALKSASFRIDDNPWSVLEPESPGFLSGPLPGDRLAKGEHTLDVTVKDDRELRRVQSIRFQVDPTGRYTAVPAVHPRVARTDFC